MTLNAHAGASALVASLMNSLKSARTSCSFELEDHKRHFQEEKTFVKRRTGYKKMSFAPMLGYIFVNMFIYLSFMVLNVV